MLKEFTVTIAGPERFDGEKPYTYVVMAMDIYDAVGRALRVHCSLSDQTLRDVKLISEETFEGRPAENCGYHWNDMREVTQWTSLV